MSEQNYEALPTADLLRAADAAFSGKGFDPQAAKGLHVGLYFGHYRSPNCAWNRPGGRPKDVTVVAVRDERYPNRPGAPLAPVARDLQVFEPREGSPAAVLVVRSMGTQILFSIEPLTGPGEDRVGFMSGGSLAETSDSRWGEYLGTFLPGQDRWYGGVKVHDYSETWAQYNANFD